MPRIDLFNFFRYTLAWVATIYATVITVQSLWGWYVWLMGRDKYIGMLRRYVIVQGLRLKFSTFWGDVLVCLLLSVTFCILWRAHHLMWDIGEALNGW